MLRLAAVLGAAFFMTAPSQAGYQILLPALCADGGEAKNFIEKSGPLTAQGMMTDQLIVQLRKHPNGDYFIFVITTKGRACMISAGTEWDEFEKGTEQ